MLDCGLLLLQDHGTLDRDDEVTLRVFFFWLTQLISWLSSWFKRIF